MKAAVLAQAFAALQVAEAALTAPGQSGAWCIVMNARVALQFALEDLPAVKVSTEPEFVAAPV
tara:strand:+ start:300 stop:488 length:189 start_codon:yes stop_codon:yes gene_type:complete